MVNRWKT